MYKNPPLAPLSRFFAQVAAIRVFPWRARRLRASQEPRSHWFQKHRGRRYDLSLLRLLSSFAQVIDLDTIDVSNLNRQFLFRPHHVSLSKAQVCFVLAPCARARVPHGFSRVLFRALWPTPPHRSQRMQSSSSTRMQTSELTTATSKCVPLRLFPACISSSQPPQSPEFGVEYFKGFDLVLNALDNVSARRYVVLLKLCALRACV